MSPERLSGAVRELRLAGGWPRLCREVGPARLNSAERGIEPRHFLAAPGAPKNGAGRIRTDDPLLAKQVLCQLSYDPVKVGKCMFCL